MTDRILNSTLKKLKDKVKDYKLNNNFDEIYLEDLK